MIKYDPDERAELLPDGRYLVTDRYRAPRIINQDGTVIEPTPAELEALRALLLKEIGTRKDHAPT